MRTEIEEMFTSFTKQEETVAEEQKQFIKFRSLAIRQGGKSF